MNPQAGLLEEAAEWRLLALLFECPSEGWREQVAALAREVEDPQLRDAAGHALEEASEGLYHSVFGPGGPAPPREVTYKNTVQAGHLLSEISCYHDAFAYQPSSREPADHISVEADFLGYLRLKEAYALANSEAEHASITHEAAERFLNEHLSMIAGPLGATLRESGIAYLSLAAGALLRKSRFSSRNLPPLAATT